MCRGKTRALCYIEAYVVGAKAALVAAAVEALQSAARPGMRANRRAGGGGALGSDGPNLLTPMDTIIHVAVHIFTP